MVFLSPVLACSVAFCILTVNRTSIFIINRSTTMHVDIPSSLAVSLWRLRCGEIALVSPLDMICVTTLF